MAYGLVLVGLIAARRRWGALAAVAALSGCEPEAPPCESVEELIPSIASNHVEGGVNYDDVPPSSGPHDPCWASWGVHEEELPDERWVHNLEHGGVVFLYNCPDGCPEAVDAMEELVTDHAILTPYTAMEARFAVVAWENRITMQCPDIRAMRDFYQAHVDDAPESSTSEPNESCP